MNWKAKVGTVTVYERPQKGLMLYLRWWDPTKRNWRHKSLGRRLGDVNEKWAFAQAEAKHRELTDHSPRRVRVRTVTPCNPAIYRDAAPRTPVL